MSSNSPFSHKNDNKDIIINKLKTELNNMTEKLKASKLYNSIDYNEQIKAAQLIDFNKNFDIERIYNYMNNTFLLINGYSKNEIGNKLLTWINIENIDKKYINVNSLNKKY